MCKKSLLEEQMSAVEQAAAWARELTRREARGPGDMRNAWRRMEARYGVPVATFWALRYRLPKDIVVSTWLRLAGAYQAECERQVRKLSNEIEIAKTTAGTSHPTLVAAARVVDETEG